MGNSSCIQKYKHVGFNLANRANITRRIKGRRQHSSVASGDFLQRMTNVGW